MLNRDKILKAPNVEFVNKQTDNFCKTKCEEKCFCETKNQINEKLSVWISVLPCSSTIHFP